MASQAALLVAKSCIIAAVALDVIAEIHSIRKTPPPPPSLFSVAVFLFSIYAVDWKMEIRE
jgi:hypothetical protein